MYCEGWLTEGRRQVVEEFRKRHRTAVFALLFTDIENSSGLRAAMGEVPAAELIERHNKLIRDLLVGFPDAEEISTAGDSFFLVFARPSDAARFALTAQLRIRAFAEKERPDFRVNIGIDLGEVVVEEEGRDGAVRDVLGMQVDIAARIADLADGGQTLMTRGIFDNARQILKGEMLPDIGELSWVSHGPYVFKGFEEPLTVCEVGETGIAPLRPPADCQSGKRATMIGTEPILGWRPAVEQQIPDTQWVLEAKLGEGGFGEVWRARHLKTKFSRVFKFCFRADRLRSLKREMTLFRILKETLGERPDIARLYSVQFEEAPYYLEIEDTPGGNLAEWIEGQGGFDNVPMELRLEIVAQIATALAAAHSVGVIHRDVKPSNVLVEEKVGQVANLSHNIQVRLTDFGIGQLADREALERAKITETGMTEMIAAMTELSSRTGTRMYMAPELTAGRQPSIQSDIYSLGVLLYQMIIGDLSQPMTTDWERRIEDPVLREDLRYCLAGEPEERYAGATEIAHRLRALPQHRAELAERQAAERAAVRRRKIAMVFACSTGLFVLLAVSLGVGLLQALREKEKTERELYFSAIVHAQKCIELQQFDRARALLARCPKKYRHWEWGRLQYLCNLDLMTLKGHEGAVHSVAFSPDGKHLATASDDHTAKLWDLATGDVIQEFKGHTADVRVVAFSPNGGYIATASVDRTARLWDVETGYEVKLFRGHSHWVVDVAFTPDGKYVATASTDGTARLWDIETGKQWKILGTPGGSWVLSVAVSPDGKRLAAARQDSAVILWDIETRNVVRDFPGHVGAVTCVAFSPDGKRLATGGSPDRTVRLWDIQTTLPLMTFSGSSMDIWDVTFSPDGSRLAAVGMDTRKSAKVWDVETGRELRTFKGHSSTVNSVAFSPNGKRLATASGDRTVKLWALETQTDRWVLEGNPQLNCIAVAPDGMSLAVGSNGNRATIWHMGTEREARTFAGTGQVWSVAFNPSDGKSLAVGFADGTVGIWNVQSGERLLDFRAQFNSGALSLAFSPDGKHLATATGYHWGFQRQDGETVAKLWETRTGDRVSTLAGHTEAVNCVAFSPDGRYIATGSHDDTARIWDAATGHMLETLPCHSAVHFVAFSPDTMFLATGTAGDAAINLWDVRTGREIRTFTGRTGVVHSMLFSPDGKRLAVASHEKAWELWEVETGRKVLTLGGHENAVLGAAMSPDGRSIATASWDSTVILWPTFPWDEDEYPGNADMPLDDRIELYKREYWRKHLAALKPGVSCANRIVDSSTYSPGVPIDVKLELVWDGDKSSVTVVENAPVGWTAELATTLEGATANVQGNRITWEIEPWTSPGVTLEYTATPPAEGGYDLAAFAGGYFKAGSGYPLSIEDTVLLPQGVLAFQQGALPGPEYAGCQDAHILIWEKYRNNNTGGCEQIEEGCWWNRGERPDRNAEHKKILIRFDLSSVPSTFSLGRATLHLYAFGERRYERRNEHTIYAARVLKRWNEGSVPNRNGLLPKERAVTAKSPQHGSVLWEMPGAMGFSDVADWESSATVGVNWPEWVALDVTESVRYFLDNPDENFGWKISQDLVRGVEDDTIEYVAGAYIYKSSEAQEVHLRPILVLVPENNDER